MSEFTLDKQVKLMLYEMKESEDAIRDRKKSLQWSKIGVVGSLIMSSFALIIAISTSLLN